MFFKSFLTAVIIFTSCFIVNFPLPAQSANNETCQSTGPLCVKAEDCATLSNGLYQWCESCTVNIRCLDGTVSYFNTTNSAYPFWDDHKKNFEATSTTCLECYYECPPGLSAPPKETVPICDSTGLGCIPGSNFCGVQPPAGNYQYCGNCSHYIYCGGFGGGSSMKACSTGTFYDQTLRDCSSASSTCRECYAPCDKPIPTTSDPKPPPTVPSFDEITIPTEAPTAAACTVVFNIVTLLITTYMTSLMLV